MRKAKGEVSRLELGCLWRLMIVGAQNLADESSIDG
jgi:hypothetical protein